MASKRWTGERIRQHFARGVVNLSTLEFYLGPKFWEWYWIVGETHGSDTMLTKGHKKPEFMKEEYVGKDPEHGSR